MNSKQEKEYQELKQRDEMQKKVAKFWAVPIGIIILIVVVWAIVSHLG